MRVWVWQHEDEYDDHCDDDDDDCDNVDDDDNDEDEDNHLAMDNGKGVNPDPPSTIFKLDRMVEQHPLIKVFCQLRYLSSE